MNGLILITDIIEKGVLLLLIILSIWSITIMFDRKRFFKSYLSESEFLKIKKVIQEGALEKEILNEDSFYHQAVRFLKENKVSFQNSQSFERGLSSFIKEERSKLEKGFNVLATLGANAPFIGLFGTVLGIIRAFAYLGSQSGSSAVMSGVSQALYATAVGLMVAIPAVVAYNSFSNQLKKAIQKLESLRDLYISKLGNQ